MTQGKTKELQLIHLPDVLFPKDTFSYDFFLKDLNKKNASFRKLTLRIIQKTRFIEKRMVQFVYRLQIPRE